MLYSTRKVGDYVVRLAIPYRQAREAARIAEMSLAVAASLGVFFAVAIFLLTRHFCRRIAALASEREEQMRRLEEAERMERFRREFIENISHEIKTPLATVMGSVEMLGGDLPLPEKERPSLVRLILRESGGTGLGLSIVKHVALFHGGTASCESEVGNGSVFVLEVPCALS